MTAMPTLLLQPNAGAPAHTARDLPRKGDKADPFDLVLTGARRLERAADEKAARLRHDEQTVDLMDEDAAADELAAEAGILPLLKVVTPREEKADGQNLEGRVEATRDEPEAGPAEENSIPAEVRTSAGRQTEAAPAVATRAAQQPAEPGGSPKTKQESEPQPANERPAAPGSTQVAEPVRAESAAETSKEAAVGDEVPRRTSGAISTAASVQGGSSAGSASLDLLSRLNQMSSQPGRVANTRPAENADNVRTAGAAIEDGIRSAPDSTIEMLQSFASGSSNDETDEGPGTGRDHAGGRARTVETNVPVSVATGPAGQLPSAGTQVVQAVASAASTTRPRAVATPAQDEVPAGHVVQSLKIQLKPQDLGQVTARMTIDGDRLSIEIEVDTIEAHRKLSNESEAIVRALRAHGILVDHVTVQQPLHTMQPGTPTNDGGAANSPTFAGENARDSSGNHAGRNPAPSTSDREHAQETRSAADSPATGARRGSGVYI